MLRKIICQFLAVLILLLAIYKHLIPPTTGFFNCNDPTIWLPYKGDTFSTKILITVVFLCFFVFVSIINLTKKKKCFVCGILSASWCLTAGVSNGDLRLSLIKSDPRCPDEDGSRQHSRRIHHVSSVLNNGDRKPSLTFPSSRFFFGFTWNVCTNLVLKTLSAVPRPHFIATCNPDWAAIDCDKFRGWVKPFNYDGSDVYTFAVTWNSTSLIAKSQKMKRKKCLMQ